MWIRRTAVHRPHSELPVPRSRTGNSREAVVELPAEAREAAPPKLGMRLFERSRSPGADFLPDAPRFCQRCVAEKRGEGDPEICLRRQAIVACAPGMLAGRPHRGADQIDVPIHVGGL